MSKRLVRCRFVRSCVAMLSMALLLSSCVVLNASESLKQVRVIFTGDTLGALEPCG